MKSLILSILITCVIILSASSQDIDDGSLYAPPSPTAQGLLKYANMQVSLYTGTPVVDIPITELKTRNASIPVSLSYHASGIKVQDIASWVGLGWSLNAGGLITRIVRGLPDEHSNGYSGVNQIGVKASQTLTADYLSKVNRRIWDGEPDMFYFNFLGNTGKFTLNAYGVPVLLPYNGFKIQPIDFRGENSKWIITDAAGVQYTFGTDESSKEMSSSKITSRSSIDFVSSWYLSEVKYPTGEAITFTYDPGSSITYKYFTQGYTIRIHNGSLIWGSSCTGNTTGSVANAEVESTNAAPKYLKTITSSAGELEFILGSSSREDLPGGKYLEYVVLKDRSTNVIRKYKLNYSYFVSDDCATELCKRLKLASVDQISGQATKAIASFVYEATNLPARNAHTIDHWGYYNSNSFSSKIPTTTYNCNGSYTFSGADRSTDTTRTKANILTRIYYPTGGFKELIYAVNKYYDPNTNQDIPVGGTRIRIVKECNSAEDCQSTYYYYKNIEENRSSGLIANLPNYSYKYQAISWSMQVSYIDLRISSTSQTDLMDLNGSHIGYSIVKVRTPSNGYAVHHYSNFDSHNDVDPEQFKFQGAIGDSQPPNEYPFAPRTSKSWERGILLQKDIFSESKKLLTREKYDYEFNNTALYNIPAYRVGVIYFSDNELETTFRVGKYFITSKPYNLLKVTTSVYDATTVNNDETSCVKKITDYVYDLDIMLPKKTISYDGRFPSTKTIQLNKYVNHPDYQFGALVESRCNTNYTQCYYSCNGDSPCIQNCQTAKQNCINNTVPTWDADAISFMNVNHQFSRPVEAQVLLDNNGTEYLLSSSIVKYERLKPNAGDVSTHYVVPKEVYQSSTYLPVADFTKSHIDQYAVFNMDNAKFRKVKTYDSYDVITGNLLRYTGSDGISKAIVWGGDNSNYVQSISENPNNPAPGSPDLQHQLNYQHKALTGVTQESDANGRIVSYEYNSFGELLLQRDNNGYIRKRFRSSEVSSDRFGGVDFTMSSNNALSGSTISFSLTDGKTTGITKYIWDFGDGQVLETTSTAVSHSYSTSGSYTVKLGKVNAEYGTVTQTKTLTIYDFPSISVSGCEAFDLCAGGCAISSSLFGGCTDGVPVYTWYYRFNGSQWFPYYGGNESSISFNPGSPGQYEVKCTVSLCGMSAESTPVGVSAYNSGCPGN